MTDIAKETSGAPSVPVAAGRLERAETALQSYQRLEEEIVALPEERIGRVTADVAQAASIALGALPNLEQLRPEFSRLGDGGAAVQALDSLRDRALAAFFAHLRALPEAQDSEVVLLLERARPLRENLLRVAESLAGFGLLPESSVASIRAGHGNIDTAQDLTLLAALFEANWERVGSKVPFGAELVEQAAQLGPELLQAVGTREVGEVRKDPSFDWPALRARAFRLLVEAYEELRRATNYVRWSQGDARVYAPSLHTRFASRGSRRPNDDTPADDASELASEQSELGGSITPGDPAAPGGTGLPGDSPLGE